MKVSAIAILVLIITASCSSNSFNGVYKLHKKFTGPLMPVNTKIEVKVLEDSSYHVIVRELRNDFSGEKWRFLEDSGSLVCSNDSLIVDSKILTNRYFIVDNKLMVPEYVLSRKDGLKKYKIFILRK